MSKDQQQEMSSKVTITREEYELLKARAEQARELEALILAYYTKLEDLSIYFATLYAKHFGITKARHDGSDISGERASG